MSWGLTAGNIRFSLILIVLIVVGFDKLGVFYAAYQRAAARIERDEMLRINCRDPKFFTDMGSHGEVCKKVEENARIGAFWHGIDAVVASASLCRGGCGDFLRGASWQLMVLAAICVAAVAYVVSPLLRTGWIGRRTTARAWDDADDAAPFLRGHYALPTAECVKHYKAL
jgi:hypothetical protein